MSKDFLIVAAVVVFGCAIHWLIQRWSMRRFWARSCQGAQWKNAFPNRSPDEIRTFLTMIVDSFAVSSRLQLQFAPQDTVLDVYHGINPIRGMPDALELETLVLEIKRRYGVDIQGGWRPDTTLGQLFQKLHVS